MKYADYIKYVEYGEYTQLEYDQVVCDRCIPPAQTQGHSATVELSHTERENLEASCF